MSTEDILAKVLSHSKQYDEERANRQAAEKAAIDREDAYNASWVAAGSAPDATSFVALASSITAYGKCHRIAELRDEWASRLGPSDENPYERIRQGELRANICIAAALEASANDSPDHHLIEERLARAKHEAPWGLGAAMDDVKQAIRFATAPMPAKEAVQQPPLASKHKRTDTDTINAGVWAELIHHHQYDDGIVRNHEPIEQQEIVAKLKFAAGAVSARFKSWFGSKEGYVVLCKSGRIGSVMKRKMEEYSSPLGSNAMPDE